MSEQPIMIQFTAHCCLAKCFRCPLKISACLHINSDILSQYIEHPDLKVYKHFAWLEVFIRHVIIIPTHIRDISHRKRYKSGKVYLRWNTFWPGGDIVDLINICSDNGLLLHGTNLFIT